MSRLLFVFLCFVSIALSAQATDEELKAIQLQKAGQTLLQKDPLRVFDKIQALGKFQESQQLLDGQATSNQELGTKNKVKIDSLQRYFLSNSNSDSLLETTRFFPDSIFQVNTRYSSEFKTLIDDYLNLKQSSARAAFFKVKALNYNKPSESKNNNSTLINFDIYWALEIMEIEAWLKETENNVRNYPKKARVTVLELQLQNELITLRNIENTKYTERNKKSLLGKLERAEKDIKTAASNYQQLKYIGFGILGLILLLGYYFRKKKRPITEK